MTEVGRAETTAERFRRIMEVPLLRFLDVEPLTDEDSIQGLSFVVSDNALNAAGALHGGSLATVLDVAAYIALLPGLADDEEAVTHSFSAWYLRPAGKGETIEARASVVRQGARVAFVTSEMRSRDHLLAVAQVTKSIIPIAQARPDNGELGE